jgi:hypothetical protein
MESKQIISDNNAYVRVLMLHLHQLKYTWSAFADKVLHVS